MRFLDAARRLDKFLLSMVGCIVLATLVPVRGSLEHPMQLVTDGAIVLLFFLHGAKLSRKAVVQGAGAWRVHLMVLLATFVMFPVLGLAVTRVSDDWINPTIAAGIILLCLMPSTVQSSIAFTSLAGGNVSVAVCSAALSNILGVVLTPLLVRIFLTSHGGGVSWNAVLDVALQLLLPFALGHLSRPLLRAFMERDKRLFSAIDRGVILLIVYTAFSAAVVEGIWHQYSLSALLWITALSGIVLSLALLATTYGARFLGFGRSEEIVIVFCGSKKSLASGAPIAAALFPSAMVGPMILPLMVFHQIQLMACAVLAQRYASTAERYGPHAVADSRR